MLERYGRLVERVALVGVLGVAAWLRLVNLGGNPGWYTDEGTHLAIVRHLVEGRTQYLAINQSTLLFAKLPLFEWLLAGAVGVWGLEMETLRGVERVDSGKGLIYNGLYPSLGGYDYACSL